MKSFHPMQESRVSDTKFTKILVPKASIRSRLRKALERMPPDLEAALLSRFLGVQVQWKHDHAEVIPLPHYKGQVDDLRRRFSVKTSAKTKPSVRTFRWQEAKGLLEQGLTTEQVRLKMQVCPQRFHQILADIQADARAQKRDPFYGLRNVRARRALAQLGCNSVEEVKAAITTGTLHPDRIENFGWKSYTDIKVWLKTPRE